MDWASLRTALGRNWPSNAPPKDADAESRDSKRLNTDALTRGSGSGEVTKGKRTQKVMSQNKRH